MDFGSLGEKKKAIFCVIPVDDSSMNYLVGMLYTQCFQALYRRADEKHNGRLPVPVRVIQDEWANVAQPESYPKILATCRSYNIKTIAAKCGYGVSTVKRALDELVKAGYIVKQARFDECKNGGQTSNLYTLCSDLLCPDEPENAPVLEDDASDESPAVQPESAPADACNASDPTPGEQSATLPTADSYSFADGFETKIGRQFCRPIRMWTGGQSIFIPP